MGSSHELYGEHEKAEGDHGYKDPLGHHQDRGGEVMRLVQIPSHFDRSYGNENGNYRIYRRSDGIDEVSRRLLEIQSNDIHLYMPLFSEYPCNDQKGDEYEQIQANLD